MSSTIADFSKKSTLSDSTIFGNFDHDDIIADFVEKGQVADSDIFGNFDHDGYRIHDA